jgi:hypothetical protein
MQIIDPWWVPLLLHARNSFIEQRMKAFTFFIYKVLSIRQKSPFEGHKKVLHSEPVINQAPIQCSILEHVIYF